MHTATGLLTYLHQRLGLLGAWTLLLIGAALLVTTGLAILAVAELLASTPDPIQLAPVRWVNLR